MRYWRDTAIPQSRFARLLLRIAFWWDGVPVHEFYDPATNLDTDDFRWDV